MNGNQLVSFSLQPIQSVTSLDSCNAVYFLLTNYNSETKKILNSFPSFFRRTCSHFTMKKWSPSSKNFFWMTILKGWQARTFLCCFVLHDGNPIMFLLSFPAAVFPLSTSSGMFLRYFSFFSKTYWEEEETWIPSAETHPLKPIHRNSSTETHLQKSIHMNLSNTTLEAKETIWILN